jgi:hypothetical protein
LPCFNDTCDEQNDIALVLYLTALSPQDDIWLNTGLLFYLLEKENNQTLGATFSFESIAICDFGTAILSTTMWLKKHSSKTDSECRARNVYRVL